MPLGTLDRTPPPFFKQGPSALSKLVVFSALALLLMVADVRFKLTAPIRAAIATVLYPVQWLVLQPVNAAGEVGHYFHSLHAAQTGEAVALRRLAAADRGLARLNLTLVANMSCVNVQCGVFRRTLQQVIAAGIDLYLIAMTNVLRWTAR